MHRTLPFGLLSLLLASGLALADHDHRDDRRHVHPISYGSGAGLMPGVSRDALAFTGAEWARAPVAVTSLTSGITLEAWVRWDGGTGLQAVMYNGNSATSGYGIYLE